MSLPGDQIETSIARTERTDLACFRSGYHPALPHWQHFLLFSEDAVNGLGGEEIVSAEHMATMSGALSGTTPWHVDAKTPVNIYPCPHTYQ